MDRKLRQRSATMWSQLCADLNDAGQKVLSREDLSDIDVLEGLRHISRVFRLYSGLEWESVDVDNPLFTPRSTYIQKSGYECPDYQWQSAKVSGNKEYRIFGNIREAEILTCISAGPGVKESEFVPGIKIPIGTGFIETPDIDIAADGAFEVIASTLPRDRNWLPLKENTTQVAVRSVVRNCKLDAHAQPLIEPLALADRKALMNPEILYSGLESTVHVTKVWASSAETFTLAQKFAGVNTFADLDDHRLGTSTYPAQMYIYGYFELAAHEALVIDMQLPDCVRWNFHLLNHWGESLDYMRDNINLNSHFAKIGQGNALRVIMGDESRNPGHPNWLNTTGRHNGTMIFRFLHPQSLPEKPSVKVLDLNATDIRTFLVES